VNTIRAGIIALWLWLQTATELSRASALIGNWHYSPFWRKKKDPIGSRLNLLLACLPRRHLRGVRGD